MDRTSPNLHNFPNETDPCSTIYDAQAAALRSGDAFNLQFEDGYYDDEYESDVTCLPTQEFLVKVYRITSKYKEYEEECTSWLENEEKRFLQNATYCHGEFDGLMCWPHASPGTAAPVPCYDTPGSSSDEHGYRFCLSNGSWLTHNVTPEASTWSDTKDCNYFSTEEPLLEKDGMIVSNVHDSTFDFITIIGYSLSTSSLILAIVLLLSFKKLRSLTNYIHVHLMISFLLFYAFQIILENQTMILLADFSSDQVWCRILNSLYQYTYVTNFFWLLAEGAHLQVLLRFPLKTNHFCNQFLTYFVISWGTPWLVVGISAAINLANHEPGCWNHWWFTRWVIYLIIAINFIIFVNVFRIIICKFRAENMSGKDYRYKLAKALFALFSLLGTPYVVFSILLNVNEVEAKDDWMIWTMYLECVYTSFQGAAVAVFFCFLNTEVQRTIKRVWYDWKMKRRLPTQPTNKPICLTATGRDHFVDIPCYDNGGKLYHYLNETSQPLIGGDLTPMIVSVITKT